MREMLKVAVHIGNLAVTLPGHGNIATSGECSALILILRLASHVTHRLHKAFRFPPHSPLIGLGPPILTVYSELLL